MTAVNVTHATWHRNTRQGITVTKAHKYQFAIDHQL